MKQVAQGIDGEGGGEESVRGQSQLFVVAENRT